MSLLRSSLLAAALSAMVADAVCAQTVSQPPPHQPPARAPAKPVSEAELQDLSGGQAVAVNEQQLKAMTSDNSVNALGSVNNGPVNVSANAFSGFSGLGNFVINTGNNNTLQGSMSVNITMTPAP